MQVKVTRLGVATYVAPDFPLVEENIRRLDDSVREVRGQGANDIVIHLKQVQFIDSCGLEFLVDLAATLRTEGGSMRLADPDGLCREILSITRVDQSIPVFDDIEGAGRSFL